MFLLKIFMEIQILALSLTFKLSDWQKNVFYV